MQFSVLKSSCESSAWGSSSTLNQCGICKSLSSNRRYTFVCPQLASNFFPLPCRCDFIVLLITVIAQFLELHPAFHYATFVRSLKLLRCVEQDLICSKLYNPYMMVYCYRLLRLKKRYRDTVETISLLMKRTVRQVYSLIAKLVLHVL